MSMQDKDIDALFSGKLKHLEAEPSAQVWKGITLELDGVKHKSKLIPLIRIAASVILVISAALFVLMRGGMATFNASDDSRKPQLVKENADAKGGNTIARVTHPVKSTQQKIITAGVRTATAKTTVKPVYTEKKNNHTEPVQTNPEIIVDNQPVLAAVNIDHAVVPDVQLVAHHDVYANDKFITANTEVPDLPAAKQKVKKRGIRTLGDIINVVVAKVDKRDDKIIEFSNTDDDGSIVSGINLGLIRIKKD